MTHPSAKIILDSVSEQGFRLTTMELTMHRFVLAEFNTHRLFSRNSASSRAIPVEKQLAMVKESPAYPEAWPSEQPGMQGGALLEGHELQAAQAFWDFVLDKVTREVDGYLKMFPDKSERLHKSLVNRLLEPFMWHKVIVTATSWENFFHQRCSELAQPEIRVVAELMKEALDESIPKPLMNYEWHMPYMEERDLFDCQQCGEDPREVSAARCARVSYLTHDGSRDVQQDVDLYRKLTTADPMHASPLEHVARPAGLGEYTGNFRGWVQLRSEVQPYVRTIA